MAPRVVQDTGSEGVVMAPRVVQDTGSEGVVLCKTLGLKVLFCVCWRPVPLCNLVLCHAALADSPCIPVVSIAHKSVYKGHIPDYTCVALSAW
jgi:hypothetical protein